MGGRFNRYATVRSCIGSQYFARIYWNTGQQLKAQEMATQGSRRAVVAAIVGNSLVMLAKFAAFFFTRSTSMLAEGIHTAADLLNQTLLLIGIVRSEKTADSEFAYGYAAERYVWALISAVGIFFLGCGVTVFHGVQSLFDEHHAVADLSWAVGVLIFSLVLEGYVL